MRAAMVGLAALLVGCGAGTDTGGGSSRVDDILALTGDPTAGTTVYSDTCAVCHGADGSGGGGGTYPDLTGETDDAFVAQQVLEGGDLMTPYDGVLTDQQIADVVAYVLSI